MPHLTATIVSLSQDMDLGSGSMANFMMLRLSDGSTVRALIGDDAAQDIVRLSLLQNGTTIPSPPGIEESLMGPAMSTHVFGGEATAQEPEQEPEPEPEAPPLPAPQPSKRSPSRRPKKVSTDDMGYPIVQMDNSSDPRDAVGGRDRDRDEDGVGQV